ncbi:MAG: very short patch repair endonuclease [Candidatus Bathyarchaeia archaeon]
MALYERGSRSYVMSKIRSTGTKPERQLHAALKNLKMRHKMNPTMPGMPDAIIPSRKIAIFVHGCFWHGCKMHGHMPKTNLSYWQPKLSRNKKRDIANAMTLKKEGWKVITIWEHDIKAGRLEQRLKRGIIK